MSSSSEAYARRHGGSHQLGDRYCAPCGWLFWRIEGPDGAAAHRREQHPEQARFERGSIEGQANELAALATPTPAGRVAPITQEERWD